MSIPSNEIDGAWRKLRMKIRDSGDRHAQLWEDGKLIIRTKRSFGAGKVDDRIVDFIRHQMKLNDDQFRDLLACPLTRDGYIEILRSKGHISEQAKAPTLPGATKNMASVRQTKKRGRRQSKK